MALITTAYAQAAAIAETVSSGAGGGVWTDIANIIDGDDATFGSLLINATGAGDAASLSTIELDAVGTALASVLPDGANVQGMLARVVLEQSAAAQIAVGGVWFATSGTQDGINQEPAQEGQIPTTKTTVVFAGSTSIDGTLHPIAGDRQTDWGLSSFDYARATAATLDFQFSTYLWDSDPSTLKIYTIEFAATYAPGVRILDGSLEFVSAISPADTDTDRGTSLLTGPGAATTGQTLEIDPATWDIGNDGLELSDGGTKVVHLRGTSRDDCIISDASDTSGSTPLIHPASGSVIADLTISLADVNVERAGLGCSTAPGFGEFTAAVLNRVTFDCQNDAIIIASSNAATLEANNCLIQSGWDCFAQNASGTPAHHAEFNTCTFVGQATASSLNSSCAYIAKGTAVFNNCTMSAADASDLATTGVGVHGPASVILNNCTIVVESEHDSGVYGLHTNDAGASIVMNGGSITSSTTGASTVYDAYAEAGTITLNNVEFDSSKISGDVVVVSASGYRGARSGWRSSRPLGGVR